MAWFDAARPSLGTLSEAVAILALTVALLCSHAPYVDLFSFAP